MLKTFKRLVVALVVDLTEVLIVALAFYSVVLFVTGEGVVP